jgi:hypothetical protein
MAKEETLVAADRCVGVVPKKRWELNVKYTHMFIAAVFCSIQSDAMDNVERSLSKSTPSIPIARIYDGYSRRHSMNNSVTEKAHYRCMDKDFLASITKEWKRKKLKFNAKIINICANTASEEMTPEEQSRFEAMIKNPLFDPNYQSGCISPLIAACSSANGPLVRSLLKANADPNKKVGIDCTPFSEIIYSEESLDNQIACINELMRGGTNPHQTIKSGHTILHTAAKHNPALLPYLLKTIITIDVNTPTDTQKTPLLYLIQCGWNKPPIKESLMALIQHGADPHKEDSNGNSAFSLAQEHINSDALAWFNAALKKHLFRFVHHHIIMQSNDGTNHVSVAFHPTANSGDILRHVHW